MKKPKHDLVTKREPARASFRVAPEMRADLVHILGDKPELIADVERSVGAYVYWLNPENSRLALSGEVMNQVLARHADRRAHWRRLKPPLARLLKELDITPAQYLADLENGLDGLAEFEMWEQEREEQWVEFSLADLRRLLRQCAFVLHLVVDPETKRGRPRAHQTLLERNLAMNLVRDLQRHNVRRTWHRSGILAQVLEKALEAAGTPGPEDLSYLLRLAREEFRRMGAFFERLHREE